MNKRELRLRMRRCLPKSEENWVETLRFWPMLRQANTIFCFLPLKDEPDTLPLISWLQEQGKRVCVPRCITSSGEMEAVALKGVDIVDIFGIPTSEGDVIPPDEIDLALVPGLAFDGKGNRLGRGKGFYDRYLAGGFIGLTCGICPATRFLSSLPTELHDRRVDFVFTPYGLFKTNDE